MDLYVTEKETGLRIGLALLPDSLKAKVGANVISYNFISVGEVKMPSGQKLQSFSWSGTFPGANNSKMPFVKRHLWMPPKTMVSIFESWRRRGSTLTLMLTETPIYCDVYLSSFEHTYSGGLGDVTYSVTFTERKPVTVFTAGESMISAFLDNNLSLLIGSRPTPQNFSMGTSVNSAQTQTYMVRPSDTLWSIAQAMLGEGKRWSEIYEINRDVIGSDPDNISVGMSLVLPT